MKENIIETVFVIQAYQREPVPTQLVDVCVLELFAQTEEEAIKRAKELIKKNYYRVAQIIEKKE